MAATDEGLGEVGFEVTSLPVPTAVRDPDTGNVVDGYRVTVRSKATGATATLEIAKSRYSLAYVKAQAEAALAPLDATVARFGASTLSGAGGTS